MVIGADVIAQEAQLRTIAIGDPKIEVAIVVPIDQGHGPPVIGKIEAGDRGDISEPSSTRIQKAAIPLMAAEGTALAEKIKQQICRVGMVLARSSSHRCRSITLRHDLSPEETSQVARVIARDIAIGDHQVFPTVVVQIRKQRSPCPSRHFHVRLVTYFTETPITDVFEQRIAFGEPR